MTSARRPPAPPRRACWRTRRRTRGSWRRDGSRETARTSSVPFRAPPRRPLLTQYIPARLLRVPARRRVALDDLERVAGRRPVLERAALEVQVERASAGGARPRRHRGCVRDIEASFHAGGAMAGQRTVVGVALVRLERDAGARALSRICALLTSSFSSATSCTISSPLTIVMRTVSPVSAHSVGLRTPSISPPSPRYPSIVDSSVYSRSTGPEARDEGVVWPER